MDTDATIKRLLQLKLTRFAYGFCLGLKDNHNPTLEQQAILAKIANQYSQCEIAGSKHERTNTNTK
jgi:hypothetical protein